jgi:uncharacterized protein YutE (UPF0331/DUF86 family)
VTPSPLSPMVDVAHIDRSIAELRSIADSPEGDHWILAAKYLFLVSIEACGVAAQQLCESERWGPHGATADAVRLLGQHDVVDRSVAEGVIAALDLGEVVLKGDPLSEREQVAMLGRLGELEAFTAQVADWTRTA